MLSRARGKLLFMMFIAGLLLLIIPRPLFYIVLARGVSVGIKLMLRRSVGFLIIVIDSILNEAAYALEARLISPPPHVVTQTRAGNTAPTPNTYNPYEIQPQHTLMELLLHGFFIFIGAILGRHWPRAAPAFRRPTHLRVQ